MPCRPQGPALKQTDRGPGYLCMMILDMSRLTSMTCLFRPFSPSMLNSDKIFKPCGCVNVETVSLPAKAEDASRDQDSQTHREKACRVWNREHAERQHLAMPQSVSGKLLYRQREAAGPAGDLALQLIDFLDLAAGDLGFEVLELVRLFR